MRQNDQSDNRKKTGGSPGNVVDLTELLRKKREERERRERGELTDSGKDFPEIPEPDFPENFGEEDPEEENLSGEKENGPRRERSGKNPEEEPLRRKKPLRKPRSLRERIGDIAVISFLLFLVLLAGLLIGTSLVSLEKITVSGNSYVEDEPVVEWFFPDEKSRILSRAVLRNILGRETPPAFSRAKIVITGLSECEIRTEEKEAAFAIGLSGENGFLIVTGDGEVLTKAESVPEHLSLITGISALSDEPMLPALTDQPETFRQLLRVIRILRDYEIESDALFVRGGGFCLQIGEVTVNLGTDEWLAEKLLELRSQLPSLRRLRGTLHLEDYDGEKKNDHFTFEVSP